MTKSIFPDGAPVSAMFAWLYQHSGEEAIREALTRHSSRNTKEFLQATILEYRSLEKLVPLKL
jgi:hypothetical protein